jgi:hypothetical protein
VGLLTPDLTDAPEPAVYVSVFNRTAEPFLFGTENIKVSYYGLPPPTREQKGAAHIKPGQGAPRTKLVQSEIAEQQINYLKVYTYEDLRARAKRQAAALAFAAGMSASAASYSAAQPSRSYETGYVQGGGNVDGDRFGYHGNYSGQTTTYDPAAVASAQASINANLRSDIAQIGQYQTSEINALSSVLRKNTVQPGEVVGGIIKFEKPTYADKQEELTVYISVPPDEHVFVFQYYSKKIEAKEPKQKRIKRP